MPLVLRVEKNLFPKIGSALESRVETVVKKSTLDVEARAKVLVPVDTGHLKSTIQSDVDGASGVVGVGAEYSVYVEHGTRYMAAQPFLNPAVEAVRPSFNAALRQIFEAL